MSRRRAKIPSPSWEHEQGGLSRRLEANRWQLWTTVAVVLLVVAALGVVGWGFLSDYIDDQQRPGSLGLRVGDRELSVSDYTTRAELYVRDNGTNNAILVISQLNSQLVDEAIVLQYAQEKDVSATDEEVTDELALKLGIPTDDPNFQERLQEEFRAAGLSEEEHRDIARAEVLRQKLVEAFKTEVPGTAEAVHYRQIVVTDQATADDIVRQLEDGADFATLVREKSENTSDAENGGDQGFIPKGLLDPGLEGVLFSLEPGEYTTFPTQNAYYVVETLETSENHIPTDAQKNGLAVNAYTDWVEEKKNAIEIVNEFDTTEGDRDKIQYVIEHANLTVS
jgi:foldase protein PrsA